MTDAELIAFRNLFQECQCLRDKMQMEKRVGPQYIAAWEQAVSDASEAFGVLCRMIDFNRELTKRRTN